MLSHMPSTGTLQNFMVLTFENSLSRDASGMRCEMLFLHGMAPALH